MATVVKPKAPVVETTVLQAVQHMQARYQALTAYAAELKAMGKDGGKIPCKLINLYHLTVKDYLGFGRRLFDALVKKDLHVQQVVYRDGLPVKDAQGNVKIMAVDAPLIPPTFAVGKDFCPDATRLSGTIVGDWGDVAAIALTVGAVAFAPEAIIASYAIRGALVYFLGKYVGLPALDRLVIIIQGYPPNYNLDKNYEAAAKIIKAGQEAHMTPEQIQAALAEAGKEKTKATGGFPWGLMIGGAVLVGGGYMWMKRTA